MLTVSEEKLKGFLVKRGFGGISQFCRANGLNRNTLHAYLRGENVFTTQFQRIAEALRCSPLDLLSEQPETKVVSLPPQLQGIVDLLLGNRKDLCIVLLGSRAGNRYGTNSDWDLGLTTVRGALHGRAYLLLKHLANEAAESCSETVDFINLDAAPQWFIDGMKAYPLYVGGNTLACKRLINRWEKAHGRREAPAVAGRSQTGP